MLRIAIDARDALGPQPRGWGRYTRELIEALSRRDDLEVRPLAGAGWRGPEALWEQVGLPLALRTERPDVVHAPNCFLALRRPCPGVVTVHDLAFEVFPEDFAGRTRKKFQWITPRAARSAERVICVSRFTADDVIARYGVDPERVRVVPNAPALALGSAEPPPGPYLLGVGDLRAKKNWRRLVSVWLELRADGYEGRLVIAGPDSGEGEALRAQAAGAPLELPGYLDDAALDALVRGAEVLVHPSLYEGFGLVVVEAMARGVPVVAARGTALTEAGGDAAVYCDPLDVASIAGAVRDALGRREELARLGLAHAAGFSWERAAAETAAVYVEAARE